MSDDLTQPLTAAQQANLLRLQLDVERKIKQAQRRYNQSLDSIRHEYERELKRLGLPDVAIKVLSQ